MGYQQIADDVRVAVPRKTSPTEVKVSIAGYRQLSEAEQDLINRAKSLGQDVANFVTEVRNFTENHPQEHDGVTRLNPARWAALADTDFQVGFMKLIRAIARPTTY